MWCFQNAMKHCSVPQKVRFITLFSVIWFCRKHISALLSLGTFDNCLPNILLMPQNANRKFAHVRFCFTWEVSFFAWIYEKVETVVMDCVFGVHCGDLVTVSLHSSGYSVFKSATTMYNVGICFSVPRFLV